ncbi:MAG TPA: GntR family transcriptional regulator [Casimicrobiaceae bacterium]|nr:GntR family transcriptional regulator [Casimicrobiaceae bacterium]
MSSLPKVALADRAYIELRNRIAEGLLRGEPISEVRLAAELQVSRTPVREAVRRLVGENVLEVTPQGIRLYMPSVEDLAEVYYTRAVLEGAAAALAASNQGPAIAKRLHAILKRARPLLATDDHVAFARLNGEFHGAIVEASGNRRIRELLASLETIIVRYRRRSLLYPDHLMRSYEDHNRIVGLFEKERPQEVEREVRDHILRAGARIVKATLRIDGGNVKIGSTAETLLALDTDGTSAAMRRAAIKSLRI